jgi:methanogenic corrinoid protein MtbC1/transposase-like protein
MRRLRLNALPDQGLEATGGAAERVALGHPASVAAQGGFGHAQLPVSGGGLNIAAVARRTEVSEHTLRKWEQRYGVLRPTRTDGGQRRYSEGDVSRVEWLAARLRDGYRIGEAAAMLTATGGEAPRSPEELRDALLAAAARPGPEGLEPLLDHAFALYPLDRALREVIAPWLVLVGERWARGELSVGQEHVATAAVRSRLERTLAEPRGAVRGLAVLACAPGEQHELGLLMLACVLRADGWEIVYLGQATPVVDAVAITREQNASMLALSVTMAENVEPLERGFGELGRVTRTRSVVIGGAAASAGLAKKLGARYVGGDLAKAVPALRKPLR